MYVCHLLQVEGTLPGRGGLTLSQPYIRSRDQGNTQGRAAGQGAVSLDLGATSLVAVVPLGQPKAAVLGVLLTLLPRNLCARRYLHTVRVCGLQTDLRSLPYGDLTEVSATSQ